MISLLYVKPLFFRDLIIHFRVRVVFPSSYPLFRQFKALPETKWDKLLECKTRPSDFDPFST